MPVYTEILPQNIIEIKIITIYDIIKILPENLKYPLNVWIGDKIARYGMTSENIIFLIEQEESPNRELKMYFSDLVKDLGIQATASEKWKNNTLSMMRLYNYGKLIIDKETFAYKEIISPVKSIPLITTDELKIKLPKQIEWNYTIYLTGGIVKNGWSANDIDMMIFDELDRRTMFKIKTYFMDILGWKVDVGNIIMSEREPIYLFKIYEGGILCL